MTPIDAEDIRLLVEMLALRPDDPGLLRRLGAARLGLGQAEAACQLLERAVALAPGDARIRVALAEAWKGRGDPARARACLEKAVALAPDLAEAWMALGLLLSNGAEHATLAVEALKHAVHLSPGDPRPANLLAALMIRLGRHEEALAAYRQVAAVGGEPSLGNTLNNIGVALDGLARREDAVAALRTAALVSPENPSIHDNLGNALLAVGRAGEAEACHRRALALGVRGAVTWSNLGNALHRQGRLEESEAAYRHAIRIAPKVAKFHTNLALTLLLEGKFAEGWREYEWRWRDHPNLPAYLRDKAWSGAEMPQGTLLLQAEQGYGDTIQFVRYLPLFRARVGRVVLACQPELVRLMGTVAGLDAVIAESAPLPKFDAAVTLMTLPGLFGTGADNIPGGVPYLSVPPGAGVALPPGEGLAGDTLKVGLAWAGRPTHGDDWNRSVPARMLEPLLAVPGVTFYSLQRGAMAERLGRPPAGRLIEIADRCADFADTAAVVAAMDLIISVDTAVVHMAGAMGKPVWVLLPPVPDFRWRMSGETTPWYPTLRLFRKAAEGGWEPVIAAIAGLLREKSAKHKDT